MPSPGSQLPTARRPSPYRRAVRQRRTTRTPRTRCPCSWTAGSPERSPPGGSCNSTATPSRSSPPATEAPGPPGTSSTGSVPTCTTTRGSPSGTHPPAGPASWTTSGRPAPAARSCSPPPRHPRPQRQTPRPVPQPAGVPHPPPRPGRRVHRPPRPLRPPPQAPTPTERWRDLADRTDKRLARDPHWPALAAALERADTAGYDVAAHLRRLANQRPLPDLHPARTLHHRLTTEAEAALTPPPLATRVRDAENATAQAAERAHPDPLSRHPNQATSHRPAAPRS